MDHASTNDSRQLRHFHNRKLPRSNRVSRKSCVCDRTSGIEREDSREHSFLAHAERDELSAAPSVERENSDAVFGPIRKSHNLRSSSESHRLVAPLNQLGAIWGLAKVMPGNYLLSNFRK